VAKSIYLIGYPLKHSVSREFQQAALDYHRLDIRYEVRETREEELSQVVGGLREPRNLGANVTLPYKEKVLSLLDETDDFARMVGAVNTIVNRGGRLTGYNTDAPGFLRALSDAGFQPAGKGVVILGAGGAARAVSFALIREGVAWLAVFNRTKSRAEYLAKALTGYGRGKGLVTEVAALPWEEDALRRLVGRCQLVVNCTTLGMRHSPQEGQSPLAEDMIGEGVLIYDLVYNPRETPLLSIARRRGAKTIDGLPMLVYQGAIAFKLWTGKDPPLEIMFKTAEKALMEEGGQFS
jgi:shikimate dehydrogenase